MECIFADRTVFPAIELTLEEIVPKSTTSLAIKARAAYRYYIETLAASPADSVFKTFRMRALHGQLKEDDFAALNDYFNAIKADAQRIRSTNDIKSIFNGYATANSVAMLIAQILFVDNCIREKLPDCLPASTPDTLLAALRAHLLEQSQRNGGELADATADFYAWLFILQTTFDKIFVFDTDIVTYNSDSGDYQITEHYIHCTNYLALAGKKLAHAGTQEKLLCQNITTGWGDGIDLTTWNALNTCYYSGISATTGKPNLFTQNYDLLLERMIPQFTLAKVRLADTLLDFKSHGRPITIVEIGAGSGALAIDLIMACKRRQQAIGDITYLGVEPSEFMRKNFRGNCERKIGATPFPTHWTLTEGSVESVNENPQHYFSDNSETLVVFSFSIHHCYHESVRNFMANPAIKTRARAIFVLDACEGHGWTKPYYMWADCESPENFDNVRVHGGWTSTALWTEPENTGRRFDVDHGWCFLQQLT